MATMVGFVTLALLALAAAGTPRRLEVIVSNATFPTRGFSIGAVYDNQDSVYLYGGEYYEEWTQALRYSISRDTIEVVGEVASPYDWYAGGAAYDGAGGVVYFGRGGGSGVRDIWRYNASNPSDRNLLGQLPDTQFRPQTVWDDENAYLIGGLASTTPFMSDKVVRFSFSTHEVNVALTLPRHKLEHAAVMVDHELGYVFGGAGGFAEGLADIIEFNLTSGSSFIMPFVQLPAPVRFPCAVWTGKHVYIIGGSGAKRETFVRFTPAAHNGGEYKLEEIEANYPTTDFFDHSCVYVKKLHRVYTFGGKVYTWGVTPPDVMWVDLEAE